MEVIKWRLRWKIQGSDEVQQKIFETEEQLLEFESDLRCSSLFDVHDFSYGKVKINKKQKI